MSNAMHANPEVVTTHDVHHDEHHVHHHKETFISKYVFSMDHKTIGKQFLITGIIWAIIGGLFSVLFRLQLGFPGQSFPILETFFGKNAAGGVITPEFYYALITMHRPSNVDREVTLKRLMNTFSEIARHLPVLFPVHPRTRERMRALGLEACGVEFMEPLGYLDFLALEAAPAPHA